MKIISLIKTQANPSNIPYKTAQVADWNEMSLFLFNNLPISIIGEDVDLFEAFENNTTLGNEEIIIKIS